jgi:ribonucleoside-triphosphate reductase
MCPNCPKVKEFMKTVDMKGELVDASTDEGLMQAEKFNVASVPTVVFLDDDKVRSVACSVEEIKRVVQNKTLF